MLRRLIIILLFPIVAFSQNDSTFTKREVHHEFALFANSTLGSGYFNEPNSGFGGYVYLQIHFNYHLAFALGPEFGFFRMSAETKPHSQGYYYKTTAQVSSLSLPLQLKWSLDKERRYSLNLGVIGDFHLFGKIQRTKHSILPNAGVSSVEGPYFDIEYGAFSLGARIGFQCQIHQFEKKGKLSMHGNFTPRPTIINKGDKAGNISSASIGFSITF